MSDTPDDRQIQTPGGWKPVPKGYTPRVGDVVRFPADGGGFTEPFRVSASAPDRGGVRWVTYTRVGG